MKLALAPSFVLLGVLVLVGCSDDPESAGAGSPTSSPATDSPSPTATDGVISPDDLPADPVFRARAQGVISDVEVSSCDTEPGEVTASGTATNSGEVARDVVVVMSWTVGATGDVVAKGVATLEDLPPGESAEWDIETSVPGAATAACVPTALAGQLRG